MTINNLKEKGFTLIELLAVIVILAIIALIAVPRIIEILNKSRLSAAEDSTMGIVEAAESYIANFMLQNQGSIPSEDLKFSCSSEGCTLTNELTNYNTANLQTLEFKGKKPTGGGITISENGSKVTAYGLLINNFICNYGDGLANCIDSSDIGPTKENPPSIQHEGVLAIVYLDPTDFTHECTKDDYSDTNSATGIKIGCMKWYAYAEDNNTYTMILDHNTTATINWNPNGDNTDLSVVNAKIADDTITWKSGLNPRLITADEIATIVEYEGWNSKTNTDPVGFESLTFVGDVQECTATNSCKYAWLYDRTNNDCLSEGCLNNAIGDINVQGYWTSTARANTSDGVWYVGFGGVLGHNGGAGYDSTFGIRPVITISKSLIKN